MHKRVNISDNIYCTHTSRVLLATISNITPSPEVPSGPWSPTVSVGVTNDTSSLVGAGVLDGFMDGAPLILGTFVSFVEGEADIEGFKLGINDIEGITLVLGTKEG